jgi:hypothetical protein
MTTRKTKVTLHDGTVLHGLEPMLPHLRTGYEYTVLAAVFSPADQTQCYVLLQRDHDDFVVCRVDTENGSVHGGSYLNNLHTAYTRFAERVGWVQQRYGPEEDEPQRDFDHDRAMDGLPEEDFDHDRAMDGLAQREPRGAPEGLTILDEPEFHSTSRMGGLSPSLTTHQISTRLGVNPTLGSHDGKVSYRWQFTVNGELCAVWDYKGTRWSYYGPKATMAAVFGDLAEHDA